MNTTVDVFKTASSRLERIQKIDVGVAPVKINPSVKLLEHILLKIDFNYLPIVPKPNYLHYQLPNL